MKIIIKVLKGQDCTLEVESTNTVLDVKNKIEKELSISIPSQKLLCLGRTLNDKSILASIPGFKDGFKLNLIVAQKPELRELAYKIFRKQYNDAMADKLSREFIRIYNSKFSQYSLDDMERFSEQL